MSVEFHRHLTTQAGEVKPVNGCVFLESAFLGRSDLNKCVPVRSLENLICLLTAPYHYVIVRAWSLGNSGLVFEMFVFDFVGVLSIGWRG